MVCLYCRGKTEIINSRHQKRSNQVWRRRRCFTCQAVFTTHEIIEYNSVLRLNRGDEYEPFLVDKLFSEVLSSLRPRPHRFIEAREVTDTVIMKLLSLPSTPAFKPQDISRVTSDVLKRFDKAAWHRFTSNHVSLL